MKKILFFVIAIFILPFSIKALPVDYQVEELIIDAYLQDNGDMLVKEQITLDGSFNGYIRDLSYQGQYSLYDASAIELIEVAELLITSDIILNETAKIKFDKVIKGNNGDSYVYEETNFDNYLSLKMFNHTNMGKKVFYLEYLLKDVVVIHQDVAELYWTFIGQEFNDLINQVSIIVHLPNESNELRGWAHGPLFGDIALNDKLGVTALISSLPANELVDIRIAFDKEIIPLGTKLSNKKALPDILKEEEERANYANRLRTKAKYLHYSVVIINIVWLIGLAVIFIYTYLKYDREYKSSFNLEYHREFPATYGPEIVEYLMKRNISSYGLSSSILSIIQKKGFTVKEGKGKKDYYLIDNETKESLTKEEQYIKKWLMEEYGNNHELRLKDIKSIATKNSKASKKFLKEYDEWLKMVKTKALNEEFYEDNLNFKIIFSLYSVLGILLFIITLLLEIATITHPFLIIGSIVYIIYLLTLTKRTIKGNDHFVKWRAFRKFLLDFGRFKERELPEISLWEKYLVYATILGIANKVRKAMEIKIKDMKLDLNNYPIFTHFYINSFFVSHLTNTINETTRLSYSKVASTNTSSAGGFGGGFSSGGGFGGGGVGGGGRGF